MRYLVNNDERLLEMDSGARFGVRLDIRTGLDVSHFVEIFRPAYRRKYVEWLLETTRGARIGVTFDI